MMFDTRSSTKPRSAATTAWYRDSHIVSTMTSGAQSVAKIFSSSVTPECIDEALCSRTASPPKPIKLGLRLSKWTLAIFAKMKTILTPIAPPMLATRGATARVTGNLSELTWATARQFCTDAKADSMALSSKPLTVDLVENK
eukprot:2640354-Heterocapsa_arctica.AAC.1